MTALNNIGLALAKIAGVKAMTDVTGFGLLGHLTEMCEGSQLSAEIDFAKVPILGEVGAYIEQGCIPGGTYRNWDSYGHNIQLADESQKLILCDPQTSGGLLIAVEAAATDEVEALLRAHQIEPQSFGQLIPPGKRLIDTTHP